MIPKRLKMALTKMKGKNQAPKRSPCMRCSRKETCTVKNKKPSASWKLLFIKHRRNLNALKWRLIKRFKSRSSSRREMIPKKCWIINLREIGKIFKNVLQRELEGAQVAEANSTSLCLQALKVLWLLALHSRTKIVLLNIMITPIELVESLPEVYYSRKPQILEIWIIKVIKVAKGKVGSLIIVISKLVKVIAIMWRTC